MKQRVLQFSHLVAEVAKLDLGYPLGTNRLRPPAIESQLKELRLRFPHVEMAELVSFYLLADGLDFSDVHVGYFLHPASKILEGPAKGEPTQISGSLAGEIVVFGSDGGGGRFVQATEGHVLYLPTGAVRSGVFDGESKPVRVVADGFGAFLDRLLADVRAFVSQSPEWKYIC